MKPTVAALGGAAAGADVGVVCAGAPRETASDMATAGQRRTERPCIGFTS